MAKKVKSDWLLAIENEQIVTRDIVTEMESSALSYAMMTIVDRALPDIRDGLKPVQRRLLYSMWTQAMWPTKPHRKSAGVTGDVMRWLHPHGSAYDALCNMVNDFEIRYPLVDGQGNFGSPDGDPAAAERYTECRLTPLALELLRDLDKVSKNPKGEVVDSVVPYRLNFAEEEYEPLYLASVLPQLLVNGATGIATGYTTDFPAHNLGEVVDALLLLLAKPDTSLTDILNVLPGPDLPTGACLLQTPEIQTLYETGRASLRFRANIVQEDNVETGNIQLVITSLPPGVRKATLEAKKPGLVERLYQLCVEKKEIPRVIDVRDESEGKRDVGGKSINLVRIVIELHKTAIPSLVIQELYRLTALEKTSAYTLRAIVDQTPRLLTLKEALQAHLDQRRLILTARTGYDLKATEAKLHILEGKRQALLNLDRVIHIIRTEAKPEQILAQELNLSSIQVESIIAMPLRALKRLEEQRLLKEHGELTQEVALLQARLTQPTLIDKLLEKELRELRHYTDTRKTMLIHPTSNTVTQEIDTTELVVLLTQRHTFKQVSLTAYEAFLKQGVFRERQDVFIAAWKVNLSTEFLLIATDGHALKLNVNDLFNVQDYLGERKLLRVIPISSIGQLLLVGSQGHLKKVLLETLKLRTKKWINLWNNTTSLVDVAWSDGNEDNIVTLVTRLGLVHRFFEKSFTGGSWQRGVVAGMNVDVNDGIVGLEISRHSDDAAHNITFFTKHQDQWGIKSLPLIDLVPKGRVAKGVIGLQFAKNAPGDVQGLSLSKGDLTWLDLKGNLIKHSVNVKKAPRYAKPELLDIQILTWRVTNFYRPL